MLREPVRLIQWPLPTFTYLICFRLGDPTAIRTQVTGVKTLCTNQLYYRTKNVILLRFERRLQESEPCVLTNCTIEPSGDPIIIPTLSRMADPWLMAGLILIGITASLTLLFAFFRPPLQSLSPREARELLKDGWISKVIDVRSSDEYAQGRYHNAVNVPVKDLVTGLPHEVKNRDHAILLYGYSDGRRGFQAATMAQELGYSNVRYLRYGSYDELEPRHRIQD